MLKFKTLLFFTSLLSIAYAQNDTLFVVASHSEGVLVDNNAAQIGQLVYSNAEQLTIPKGGYALVVLKKGHAYRFTSSTSIKRIQDRIKGLDKSRLSFGPRGCGITNFELMGAPTNQYSGIAGDSILVAIKTNHDRVKPPYKIQLTDMFGKVLFADSTVANWRTCDVKYLLAAEKFLLFNVSAKGFSAEHLLKCISDENKKVLNSELVRVTNAGASELLKLAVLELNDLYYDHMFLLYKLTRSNYQPENEILSEYLSRLKKKYEFDLFNFQE